MSHFLISYAGNKRKEFKIFEENIVYDDKNIFIEPFCGSCAMSFNIYKKRGFSENDLYVLNDLDTNLFNLLMLMKHGDVEEIIQNVEIYREMMQTKEEYVRMIKENPQNVYVYIVKSYYYSIREGLFNKDSIVRPFHITPLKREFIDFIKNDNVILHNKNWEDVFNEYKDNSTALFLLDPPYLMSCNGFYDMANIQQYKNIYEYFFENNETQYKARIYFILEYIWIVKLLFKNKKFYLYDKLYQPKKKKTVHAVIEW